jgi:alkanesulfonate monooxygenase SsuD/methylene tetrahydromethanopterin reductase-like flavin-dependent oxidoreductase (luciferase family)
MRFGLGPMTMESTTGWRCAGCRRPPDGGCCGRKQVDIYEEVLEHAVTAEWWGFDSVWVGEHHFTPDSFNSSSSVVAAGVAQRTEFVRVGVMPTLGLVNALYVAEEVACVDNISNGRTIVAGQIPDDEVVRGWSGSKANNSEARIIDDIAVLRKAWGPNPFNHHSEFHTIPMNNEIHTQANGLDRITVQPNPAQLDVPLWITGGQNAASVARQTGAIFMGPAHLTLGQLAPLYEGLNATHERIVPLIRDVFIAPTSAEAHAMAEPVIIDLYRSLARAGVDISFTDFADLAKDRLVVGDPDECIEQLYRYERELGVNYVVARLVYHNMHPGDSARAIQLFGQAVVPEFRMFGLPDEIRKVV